MSARCCSAGQSLVKDGNGGRAGPVAVLTFVSGGLFTTAMARIPGILRNLIQ